MKSKTIAQLEFIIKDAGEAAICMKEVNPVAEAKYLDQVNDATTELHRRRNPVPRKKPVFKTAAQRSYSW